MDYRLSTLPQLIAADLAPTVLDLFGVPTPGYMDGKTLVRAG